MTDRELASEGLAESSLANLLNLIDVIHDLAETRLKDAVVLHDFNHGLAVDASQNKLALRAVYACTVGNSHCEPIPIAVLYVGQVGQSSQFRRGFDGFIVRLHGYSPFINRSLWKQVKRYAVGLPLPSALAFDTCTMVGSDFPLKTAAGMRVASIMQVAGTYDCSVITSSALDVITVFRFTKVRFLQASGGRLWGCSVFKDRWELGAPLPHEMGLAGDLWDGRAPETGAAACLATMGIIAG